MTILNGYGPTENTTFTTCHLIERTSEDDIPIGRPIPHTQVWILDTAMRPVPVGVAGEICAAGDGLSRGYLNDSALTGAKFVPHPIEPGRRIYRTGDRGRWRADGVVEYLGRRDDQLKIRGHRVEPAEIESRIRQHEGVTDVIVLLVDLRSDDGPALVAYIAGEVRDRAALLADLRLELPDYMIPAHFVVLDRFPLNANGKVDRRPCRDRSGMRRPAVRPPQL